MFDSARRSLIHLNQSSPGGISSEMKTFKFRPPHFASVLLIPRAAASYSCLWLMKILSVSDMAGPPPVSHPAPDEAAPPRRDDGCSASYARALRQGIGRSLGNGL